MPIPYTSSETSDKRQISVKKIKRKIASIFFHGKNCVTIRRGKKRSCLGGFPNISTLYEIPKTPLKLKF